MASRNHALTHEKGNQPPIARSSTACRRCSSSARGARRGRASRTASSASTRSSETNVGLSRIWTDVAPEDHRAASHHSAERTGYLSASSPPRTREPRGGRAQPETARRHDARARGGSTGLVSLATVDCPQTRPRRASTAPRLPHRAASRFSTLHRSPHSLLPRRSTTTDRHARSRSPFRASPSRSCCACPRPPRCDPRHTYDLTCGDERGMPAPADVRPCAC